jgi:AraC-like DNA-binding protein
MTLNKLKNELNVCLLNNKCLLFEQIYITLKDKFSVVNLHEGFNEQSLEKIVNQESGIIILDLYCITLLLEKINGVGAALPEHIPVMLFLKRDETIPATILENKIIKNIIVLPCSMHEIIEQIELVNSNIQKNKIKQIFTDIITKTNTDAIFIEKLERIIIEQIEYDDVSVNTIAQKAGLSPENLNKAVKRITGLSSVQFILQYRLKIAKEILEKDKLNVQEVAIKNLFS